MDRGREEISVGAACVPNIGARGRRRRLGLGLACSLLTLGVIWLLVTLRASTPAFLAVGPFTLLTALYFFQAKEKT